MPFLSSLWSSESDNLSNGDIAVLEKLAQDDAPTDQQYEQQLAILESLHRSQAVIEFHPSGEIIDANENFLATVGYALEEIQGQHHRMFVDPQYAESPQYHQFWNDLRDGQFQSAEFQRFGKGGRVIWIQATYNPVLDENGNVCRVVKFATDITRQKQQQKEIQDRSQAVIEFEPDGTIITANELFTQTVGYSLSEIQGRHHRMFMPPGQADTAEYQQFWPSLARGEFRQGEFKRVDKSGADLWLRGAYNPTIDRNGNVVRVVKMVSNITEEVQQRSESRQIGQEIARSVEEMASAIAEISESSCRTAHLASDAEMSAEDTKAIVSELNENSTMIGRVIDVIQDLSDQTNLLALNATIEAARAGEAGRGFAIVASEVKTLATQTSKAAAGIRENVETIQGNVSGVVDAIEKIAGGVAEVNKNSTVVAAAVEEQSSLMDSMNHTAQKLLSLNPAE